MTVTTRSQASATQPIRRGQETETDDFELSVQNLLEPDKNDWPNEAGFAGLTEVLGPVELKVTGSIPTWVQGALYRTGPGQFDLDDTAKGQFLTTHWFDGFGQSHKFEIIPDGEDRVRVEYSSRRQAQDLVDQVRKTGRRDHAISFAQRRDPCVGLFGKVMSVWKHGMAGPVRSPGADNVNVAVLPNLASSALPPPSNSTAAREIAGHINEDDNQAFKNLWLTTDSAALKQMDPDTLEPIRFTTQAALHPDLQGPMSCAHTQRDPDTGDLFNYNLEMGRTPTYRVWRIPGGTGGKAEILATIGGRPDVKPAYIHSFFLTQSFVVLCIPSTHLAAMGLSVVWNRNIADSIEEFDQSKLCKWFIVDRRGGRGVVAEFETPAGFFFHSVNAFEEEKGEAIDNGEATTTINVFCDAVQYPSLDVIRSFELDVVRNRDGGFARFWGDETRNRKTQARLVRYRFPVTLKHGGDDEASSGYGLLGSWLPSGETAPPPKPEKVWEIPAPRVGELPTINAARAARPYRYVYSLPNRGRSTLLDGIVKTDLVTRESLYWDNPQGHTPGEAIFVPRPGGDDEDDGVLLSVVLDGFGRKSYLLCLDARTMTEMGRAECEWAIAHGFHGVHSSGVAPRG